MRKWIVRLAVVVAFVLIVVALRATVWAPEPVRVRVVAVERGRVEATITNSKAGTIEARRRAMLSPGTSGNVVELLAVRGDKVSRGDLLMRLDDVTQRAQLVLAERVLAVAEAFQAKTCVTADRALRELERNRRLADEQIVSVDVLDRLQSAHEVALSDCAVAAAQVERERASIDVARAELGKTAMRAPFEAVIAEVSIELGEWVTPSVALFEAPDLIEVIDTSSLYVSAPMDEVDAGKLHLEQRVRVTIDSLPDREFGARVARIAPYVLDLEEQNRTLEIEVELDDRKFSATLLPGTSADVEVILDVREDVLRIPSYCLLEGGRVLVLAQGELLEREVEIGVRNWDFVEVTGGLSEGESVVTNLDRADVRAGAEASVEVDGAAP